MRLSLLLAHTKTPYRSGCLTDHQVTIIDQNSYVKCCTVLYHTTSILEIIKSLPFQCELTYDKLAVLFIESLEVGGESKRNWHR